MTFVRRFPPRTVGLAAAVAVGYFVDAAVFLLLLLSSSSHGVGWWVTAVVLANLVPPVLFAPVAGWVVGRVSGRWAWSVSLGVSAWCSAGMGLLGSPVLLVGLAAVQSLCAVVIGSAVFTLLPLAAGIDDRRASSFVVGTGSIAAITAPPLAAFLSSGVGINGAFLGCAGLLGVGSAAVALAAPGDEPIEVESTAWHEVWLGTRTVQALASVRVFVPLVLGVVVVTSMEGVSGVFYLQDVAGSALIYSVLLALWATGSLVGALWTGRRTYRAGAMGSVVLGGLLVSLALLIEGLVPSAVIIGLVFVVGGFGNAVHNVGVRNLVYEQVPRALTVTGGDHAPRRPARCRTSRRPRTVGAVLQLWHVSGSRRRTAKCSGSGSAHPCS